MTRPPVRWAHSDLPEELSRLIASAAPLEQDAAALARMRERLHDSLGPTFETRLSGANPGSHVLSLLHRGKWLCAAALATAGLSFFSVQSLQTRTSTAPGNLQPVAAEVASVANLQPSAVETVANVDQQPSAAPAPRTADAQPGSDVAVGSGAERRQTPARAEHSIRALASSERGRGSARSEQGARASAGLPRSRGSASPEQVAKASTHEQSSKAEKRAAASGETTGLAAELRGLAEIRNVLHSSPTRALELAEAQEALFIQGALGPERELLRIEALIRAGRTDDAKRRATRMLNASNNPPYRERIEKLFAQKASPRLAADGVAKQVTRE